MGWRFSRRIKLLPGVSINLSKSGVSTSLGPRGAKVTIGHGKMRETVGIPGTGISYTETRSLSAPSEAVHLIEVPQAQAESGWVVAGRAMVKVLYWLTIGVIVLFGAVLIGVLASGSKSKRNRW